MNNKADIQLKISDFLKKYKKIIFIVIVVWTIIFAINLLLGNQKDKNAEPSTTYSPHTAIINENDTVPEKLQQPIETIIDTYFNYCNNGEYENAYDIISEKCKENKFQTLESFIQYASQIFNKGGKIYNIQNYSNLEDSYVYNIRILENIMANGTTGGYAYYEEKVTIIGKDKDNLKLNIDDFIDAEKLNIFGEDDNIKIEILNKTINYSTEVYKVKFTNKTEYPIVIANGREELELAIYIGDQIRKVNLVMPSIAISPNSNYIIDLEFPKFADDEKNTELMIFNAIRVLPIYSGQENLYEQEIKNAIKLYSLTITL